MNMGNCENCKFNVDKNCDLHGVPIKDTGGCEFMQYQKNNSKVMGKR